MTPHRGLSLLFAVVCLMSSCAAQVTAPRDSDTDFVWKAGSLATLDVLKAKKDEPCPTVGLDGIPDAWVTEADLPQLMALLDSTDPCANVFSLYSSFRDCRASTVGHEAAFIIEGFRKGRYPPELNSGQADLNIEEIKIWWTHRTELRQ
ncbi:hypothetical protein [Desulfoluna sp.]|uniref:hypothetical protein n=1 Tax=Desulfoluna sp. TaxID=2045199 RepID=UPI00262A46D5|nr:hypothetical protein [Desulfoluna sp.]